MCAEKRGEEPKLLRSVFTNRCPRCNEGRMFVSPNPYHLKTTMRMHEHCPVCGQRFELQTGFYFGTGFVSYGLSVFILALIFIAWALTIGLSFRDNSIYWCLALGTVTLIALQPVLQRLARSIWIAFFIRYDRNWASHKGSSEIFQ
jgi:uncharacterized protein (DUF983 family)